MERLDAFTHDLLTEVALAAERSWWLRRAEDFERAKPKPAGEFYGRASREQLREQWLRLDQMARACRARAHVSAEQDARTDVGNVLREVA